MLTGALDPTNASCAIEPVYTDDVHYKASYDMILTDKCRIEDNKWYKLPDELASTLLSFYFNANEFLIGVYGIHSFDETIVWTIENEQLPFDTIKRVHNCAWKVHGNKLDELSNVVLEYYYLIAKQYWLHDYVDHLLAKYAFSFIPRNNNTVTATTANARAEVYHIVLDQFFTYHFFITTVKKFVLEYQDQWENIDSPYKMLKNYVFDKLLRLIEEKQGPN